MKKNKLSLSDTDKCNKSVLEDMKMMAFVHSAIHQRTVDMDIDVVEVLKFWIFCHEKETNILYMKEEI